MLLEQLQSVFQLRSCQPHIFRAVKANKWYIVKYFISSLCSWYPLIEAIWHSVLPWNSIGGASACTLLLTQSHSNDTLNILWIWFNAAHYNKSAWYAVFPIYSSTTNAPTITKPAGIVQSKVLGWQQDILANCIFDVSTSCVDILLLVCLNLQQLPLDQLMNVLPGLHLVMRSLYQMYNIQMLCQHVEPLPMHYMHGWHTSRLHQHTASS